LKTGKWPWSPEIQNLYKKTISQNNIINIETNISLNNAQTIYNQNAIIELLSWKSKEGDFILNGLTIGHTQELPENINNIIKCGQDSNGDISMKSIVYTGYNSNSVLESNVETVKNSDIPNLVNGFKFLQEECNPCLGLQDPANYSCPFSLNKGNDSDVSPIWDYLWNLGPSSINKSDSKPENILVSIDFDKTQFPLINQLKQEITNSNFIDLKIKKIKKINTPFSNSTNISDINSSTIPTIFTNTNTNTNTNYSSVKNMTAT
jgi:hypothetical protein